MPGSESYGLPPCPDCDSDVFVDRSRSTTDDYVCRLCGTMYDG